MFLRPPNGSVVSPKLQHPQGTGRLSAEHVLVECVDARGRPVPPGESGEIVVTHLATRDFPFLRYRTGDVGRLARDACACGRGLPLLAEVEGRSTDFVVAADGTRMHGLALIYVLRDLPQVAQFKIVQHDRRHTEVLLVPREGFGPAQEAHIVEQFRRRLGAAVEVRITRREHIPREASGKYRYVVSHVEEGEA